MEQILENKLENRFDELVIPHTPYIPAIKLAEFLGVDKRSLLHKYNEHKEMFKGVKDLRAKNIEDMIPMGVGFTKEYNHVTPVYRFGNGYEIMLSTNKNIMFTKPDAAIMCDIIHKYTKKGTKKVEPVSEPASENYIPDPPVISEPTFESDDEKLLCLNLAKAYASGDTMKLLNAALNIDRFRQMQIKSLKQENKSLKKELDNAIGWNERASVSRIIKTLSSIMKENQKDIYSSIYYKLTTEYKLPLEERGKYPLINGVKQEEWPLVYKAISVFCSDRYLDTKRIFDAAGVDTLGLDKILD